jgi:hypothetical protein
LTHESATEYPRENQSVIFSTEGESVLSEEHEEDDEEEDELDEDDEGEEE